MSDNKYGRIYTEDDVVKFAESLVNASEYSHSADSIREALQEEDTTFPADEPVFVLRAQDKKAESTIHYYFDRCRSGVTRSSEDHLNGIERAFRAFHKFRADNPDRMKDAD